MRSRRGGGQHLDSAFRSLREDVWCYSWKDFSSESAVICFAVYETDPRILNVLPPKLMCSNTFFCQIAPHLLLPSIRFRVLRFLSRHVFAFFAPARELPVSWSLPPPASITIICFASAVLPGAPSCRFYPAGRLLSRVDELFEGGGELLERGFSICVSCGVTPVPSGMYIIFNRTPETR